MVGLGCIYSFLARHVYHTIDISTVYHTHTYTAGFDYVPMTAELTFEPGTTSVCGTVGQVMNDVIVEGAESFSLLLSTQNDRVLIQQNMAQVVIEDNDGMCSVFAYTRVCMLKCKRVHIVRKHTIKAPC